MGALGLLAPEVRDAFVEQAAQTLEELDARIAEVVARGFAHQVLQCGHGGITEETTVMRIPCITLRDNTERPETVTIGTNELIGTNPNAIAPALRKLFSGNWKKGAIPEMWDGQTAPRIVTHLTALYAL